MDEVLYEVPTQTYHKYVVTYQNGILKKYKSTNETAVPTNLVKAGEGVTTTTSTTTTTAAVIIVGGVAAWCFLSLRKKEN